MHAASTTVTTAKATTTMATSNPLVVHPSPSDPLLATSTAATPVGDATTFISPPQPSASATADSSDTPVPDSATCATPTTATTSTTTAPAPAPAVAPVAAWEEKEADPATDDADSGLVLSPSIASVSGAGHNGNGSDGLPASADVSAVIVAGVTSSTPSAPVTSTTAVTGAASGATAARSGAPAPGGAPRAARRHSPLKRASNTLRRLLLPCLPCLPGSSPSAAAAESSTSTSSSSSSSAHRRESGGSTHRASAMPVAGAGYASVPMAAASGSEKGTKPALAPIAVVADSGDGTASSSVCRPLNSPTSTSPTMPTPSPPVGLITQVAAPPSPTTADDDAMAIAASSLMTQALPPPSPAAATAAAASSSSAMSPSSFGALFQAASWRRTAARLKRAQIGFAASLRGEKAAAPSAPPPLVPPRVPGASATVAVAPSAANKNFKPLLPPQREEHAGRKLLVLDLDETLVHSSFKPVPGADFIIPVEIDRIVHNVYVSKRPGLDKFMAALGPHFEIVVFTASLAKYADPVLDALDQPHGVVHHRLFREACIHHKGNYVKDLGMLGRDLRTVLILDNSPASYLFHRSNAVPISSWFNDESDTELVDLVPFLVDLVKVDNVMTVLGSFFFQFFLFVFGIDM